MGEGQKSESANGKTRGRGGLGAIAGARWDAPVAQNAGALPHVAVFAVGPVAIRQSDNSDLLEFVCARS